MQDVDDIFYLEAKTGGNPSMPGDMRSEAMMFLAGIVCHAWLHPGDDCDRSI